MREYNAYLSSQGAREAERILKSGRVFVGDVNVVAVGASANDHGGKTRRAFLFNDLIVLAKVTAALLARAIASKD